MTGMQASICVVQFVHDALDYLRADLETLRGLLGPTKPAENKGRLGFPIIAAAMGAFDLFGWLLFEDRGGSEQSFIALAERSEFFDQHKYVSAQFLYGAVRCGVVHQLYPKDVDITVRIDPRPFFVAKVRGEDRLVVNAWALYNDVLTAIAKIANYIQHVATDEQRLRWSKKLDERQLADNSARGPFNFSDNDKFPRLSDEDYTPEHYAYRVTSSKQ